MDGWKVSFHAVCLWPTPQSISMKAVFLFHSSAPHYTCILMDSRNPTTDWSSWTHYRLISPSNPAYKAKLWESECLPLYCLFSIYGDMNRHLCRTANGTEPMKLQRCNSFSYHLIFSIVIQEFLPKYAKNRLYNTASTMNYVTNTPHIPWINWPLQLVHACVQLTRGL